MTPLEWLAVYRETSVCVCVGAVGSRHLCSEPLNSYYGFHVACRDLCICFDRSLFGMPSLIKMLGIHLIRTNDPLAGPTTQYDDVDPITAASERCASLLSVITTGEETTAIYNFYKTNENAFCTALYS